MPFLWIRFDGPALLVLSLIIVLGVELFLQLNTANAAGDESTLTSALDITFSAAYALILSILLSVCFELFYFATRAIGSMLLRIESLWNFAAPAIDVFILTGEPILRAFFLDKQIGPTEIVAAVVAPGILVLLLLFPVFRGMNATFLLAGAFIARVLLLPVEMAIEKPVDFAVFQPVAYWVTISVFLVLQNRRRLGLSPYYEVFRIPGNYQIAGIVFAVLNILVYVYYRGLESPHAVIHFLTSSSIIFWVLSSYKLNRASLNRSRSIRPGLAAALLLIAVSFAGYHSFALKDPNRIYRVCNHGGLTCEMLSFSGMLLDFDADNNSMWPGEDPDSTNSAIRADGEFQKKTEDIYIPRDSSANRNPVFVTVVVPKDTPLEKKKSILRGTAEIRLAGSDDPRLALQSLLTDYSSAELYTRPTGRSVFSYLVDDGYTTICTGHADYFKAGLEAQAIGNIDNGCQIFVPLQTDESKKFTSLRREVLSTYRKYRKAKNAFWVHSDGSAGVREPYEWFEMTNVAAGAPVLLVYLFLDDGPLVAVYRDRTKATNLGNVSLSSPRSASGLFFRFTGLSSKDRPAEEIIFLNQRFGRDPWTQSMSKFFSSDDRLPSRSARLSESGVIMHFDGRTGAKWSTDPLALLRSGNDSLEGVGLEGSPADEPAVDVRFRE